MQAVRILQPFTISERRAGAFVPTHVCGLMHQADYRAERNVLGMWWLMGRTSGACFYGEKRALFID